MTSYSKMTTKTDTDTEAETEAETDTDTEADRLRVAIFRPSGRREDESVELLEGMGHEVLSDPLLEPRATSETPFTSAEYTILTSVTGVDLALSLSSLDPEDLESTHVCAIGPKTRDALEERGVEVSVVPDEYTSTGLVECLGDEVEEKKVEVARSDHGSQKLIDGLNDKGAFVHETVLYELVRPEGGGDETVEGVLEGEVDAVLFTSSLTVEHLLEAADSVGEKEEFIEKLNGNDNDNDNDGVFVGAIGEPTRETAESVGIDVDYVPEEETFESLASGLDLTVNN
ncbi:MAG: uroporphyrinogen-III synthase [Halobacteria archaeon]|nr:uroporphyrinogen-III synthase [Halobacteria archaeon]